LDEGGEVAHPLRAAPKNCNLHCRLAGAAGGAEASRGTAEEVPVEKGNELPDVDDSVDALEAKIARAELQARHYEAQIRVIEARRKLAELRRSLKTQP
jgi:hypothetical protein